MRTPDPEPSGSQGQPADLSRLVAHATPILHKVAGRLMGAKLRQRCRTSDLVQSALVEAIASLPSFRGQRDSEFVGWTLRIMERNALDRQRRLVAKKRAIDREEAGGDVSLQDLVAGGASPSQVAIGNEEMLRVAVAMRKLPDDQRRVLQIVTLRGGTHADAARALARSEGACRVLLARARANLLVCMAKPDDHDRF